jgi:integrase
MAYAEKRGKGPTPWRVKYKLPDGSEGSESGFETKKAALDWGRDQESKIRHGTWVDLNAGDILVADWCKEWTASQNVALNTEVTRKYLIEHFIIPKWGKSALNSITPGEVNEWEKSIPSEKGVSVRTATEARSLLSTILGDAVTARPPILQFNPAARLRNRGKKSGRRLAASPPTIWATPLESLLIAERAALLSGRDDEFTMLVAIAYTGMRWAECLGLEREFLADGIINIEWQLAEIVGKFHRLPPKDDSYRSVNIKPFVPLDLPPFLSALLAQQALVHSGARCRCAGVHGGSGKYLYLTPEGGHQRRCTFSRLTFRPACDGRVPAIGKTPARLVIADAATWPGIPVARWIPVPATSGEPFEPPSGPGSPRLVSSDDRGRCAHCGRSARRRLDGTLVMHKTNAGQCPGSGRPPAEDPPLVSWLPVKYGLTPHGLRHSHKTWMIEDEVPEILAEIRLGHEMPGIRGVYSHVSGQMRHDLKAALQARWEASLKARAELCPHSAVPVLDQLLAPYRQGRPSTPQLISQIPPSRAA